MPKRAEEDDVLDKLASLEKEFNKYDTKPKKSKQATKGSKSTAMDAGKAIENKEVKKEIPNQPIIVRDTRSGVGSKIIGTIVGYGFVFLIIIGIAYAIHGFSGYSNANSTPQLSDSWVSQFFTAVNNRRGMQYTECSSLNSLAAQRYQILSSSGFTYTNYGEDVLAPIAIYPGSEITYTTKDPAAYLADLQNNYTSEYNDITNSAYSYYGYYIYNWEGNFASPNGTSTQAPTLHVLVELSSSC